MSGDAVKLTVSMVEIARAAGKARELPDAGAPGLRLRVAPTGAKSWVCRLRIKGGPMKVSTLGRWPEMSLAEARVAARALAVEAAKGVPPASVAEVKPKTWGELLAEYVALELPKLRSGADVRRVLEKETAGWSDRPLASIGRKDVVALLDGIAGRGAGVQANRVLAFTRRVFSWAMARGEVEANPAAGVEKPGVEVKRDRVLSDAEVRDLWRGLERVALPWAPMARLLLLTGQRLREVAEATWSEFDLEAATWTIPATRAKNGERHMVPLSPLAIEVLRGLPRLGDFVITTTGDRPVSGFAKALLAVQAGMVAEAADRAGEAVRPMEPWTFHDLRRTAASGMAAAGARVEAIERVLNHRTGLTVGGLVRVYNRHTYEDEKREALQLWASRLASLVA